MNRDGMLQLLHTVQFAMINPQGSWKDIGFTEREIWVNSKGYGYVMCDEPTQWWEGCGIEETRWNEIRRKIANNSITLADIEGTSLEDLIDEFGFDENFNNLHDELIGLLNLPETPPVELFCMQTFDGNAFFTTEESFKKAYERDWCDYDWEDLSDQMLHCWIKRLLYEKILSSNDMSTNEELV